VSRRARGERRQFFAHEVVQTSAMDCGPAALKSLLEGFGIRAHYGRLREACHTTVDGSSIDTLEDLAGDWVWKPARCCCRWSTCSCANPMRCGPGRGQAAFGPDPLRGGVAHGGAVDPGHGPGPRRRWMSKRDLLRDLYVHEMPAPAADFAAWTREPGFLDPLRLRLHRLGVRDAGQRIAAAAAGADWRPLCALEACARATEQLLSGKVVSRPRAARAFECLWQEVVRDVESPLVPETLWSARLAAPVDGQPMLTLRGALALRVSGRDGQQAAQGPPPDLAAVLADDQPGPARKLLEFLRADGLLRSYLWWPRWRWPESGPWWSRCFSAALSTSVSACRFSSSAWQRRALCSCCSPHSSWWNGLWRGPCGPWAAGWRCGCARLFCQNCPCSGIAISQSRPISDMAERAHLLHWLRLLPGRVVSCARDLRDDHHHRRRDLAVSVGRALGLDAGGADAGLAVCFQPALVERDLRMRGHAGGLARFYLDALLACQPFAPHTAEPALRSEHGGRLREWARAARGRHAFGGHHRKPRRACWDSVWRRFWSFAT